MLTSLSRPHFFPGQLLDYRDFNRLSEQGDKVSSLLGSRLLHGGGILLQALREFAIETRDNLTIVIKPGMGVLPNGEMLVLNEDRALDLATYRATDNCRLIVGIQHQSIAEDPYTDDEDPSIQGFRTQSRVAQVVVVAGSLPEGALELFRVVLSTDSRSVRTATLTENWSDQAISPSGSEAILDLRFRKSIVPLTFAPLDFPGLVGMRRTLYGMEEAHRRIQKIFLIEDGFGCRLYLSQLHAEVLSVPYQPLKVAFLVAEFADKLALFLESVARKCPTGQPNFNREIYLELSRILDEARVRHALPRALPFDLISRLGERMEAFTRFAEQRFTLLNAVEEALLDLKDRGVDFPDQTTFAGHLFRRVDYLVSTDKERVTFQSTQSQVRKLQARYRSGDQVTRTGVFLRDGKITLDFAVPQTDSPVVIWFPQYLRRKGARLEYGINGKTLLTENSAESDADNLWKNRGLIIQPEALVPQGNRLTIRVEEADLDYGFFEAAIYQPVSDLAGGMQ